MQDLLTLLHQQIRSIGPDCDIIRQNIQAADAMPADMVAAIEARVRAEELKAEYRRFKEGIACVLDPIEIDCGGIPTFKEWLLEKESTYE